MKGIPAVAAVILFVLLPCVTRVEAQQCGPIPFHACALTWKCTSDAGWQIATAEPIGTPCAATNGGPIDGRCQDATSRFGSTATCVRSPAYEIGGKVSGLSPGNTVILQNNNNTLTASNGPFDFSTYNAGYNVTVVVQPSGQQCNVFNGSSAASRNSVSNIMVACATPTDITPCDSTLANCVSEATICANVSKKLMNPPTMSGVTPPPAIGFVCIAGGLPPVYGGMGREATDPPQTPMSPNLITNIASSSKTITAVAILQLLAQDGLTTNTKISPFIYPDWFQGPFVNQITFGELLTHTSGFGQLGNCGNADAYSDVKGIVAAGVTPGTLGKSAYGNCNFALLRELMPALILNPSPVAFLPDGPLRAAQSSAMYINFVNGRVLQPVGVPTSTCAPPAANNGMLSYPSPAGTTPGNNWGDWSLLCGGGGWNLSTNQLFSVINGIANGALLNMTWQTQMLTGCLGWDCAVRADCPSPNVCKNGYLPANGNSVAVWTYAGIFTTVSPVIPVVVVVNSPTPPPFQGFDVPAGATEAPDIIDLVECSYSQAFVRGGSGIVNPCP